MGALIFVVALVVVALVLVFAGVKTVSQGTNWTIERFGRYTRTLPPGLHLIVPFVDTVGRKMNMQENVLDIPPQKVITKDNATVQVDAVAFYQVVDAARAAYEVQAGRQGLGVAAEPLDGPVGALRHGFYAREHQNQRHHDQRDDEDQCTHLLCLPRSRGEPSLRVGQSPQLRASVASQRSRKPLIQRSSGGS